MVLRLDPIVALAGGWVDVGIRLAVADQIAVAHKQPKFTDYAGGMPELPDE